MGGMFQENFAKMLRKRYLRENLQILSDGGDGWAGKRAAILPDFAGGGIGPNIHPCAGAGPEVKRDMSALSDELLRAVDLALAGHWDEAHELVQQHEGDAMASWIHAVLHKHEGDLGNSRYWYQNAGRMNHVNAEPHTELAAIREELLTGRE
jgi:hypothetical protein